MIETPTTSPNEHPNLGPGPAVPLTDRSPLNARDIFLIRVAEYESQGPDKSCPFESLMVAVQADLFRVASRLADDANRMLAGCTTVANIGNVEAGTSRYLGVTRRIARVAQLEVAEPREQ